MSTRSMGERLKSIWHRDNYSVLDSTNIIVVAQSGVRRLHGEACVVGPGSVYCRYG